jgi:hypothetical protein
MIRDHLRQYPDCNKTYLFKLGFKTRCCHGRKAAALRTPASVSMQAMQ